jgi:hypothetical protein
MTSYLAFGLFFCAIISLGLTYFQYYFRNPVVYHRIILATLRFFGLFGLCLLVLNPKIEQEELTVQKTPLIFLYDNSASIRDTLSQREINSLKSSFAKLPELQKRFDVDTYTFGENLKTGDSLDFKERTTDLDDALRTIEQSYLQEEVVIVLASDGQQNTGRDYTSPYNENLKVFPIVMGDTARFQDVRLGRLNTNRYAFSGNQFPVEIRYTYYGEAQATSEIKLFDNEKLVHRLPITLDNGNSSGITTVLFTASQPGLHRLRAEIQPLPQERNTNNNILETAIEVIDERIKIGLVSTTSHPDIGALKRSIESQEHREFRKLSPNETISGSWKADIYILLNPDSEFESVYEYLDKYNLPTLTLAGPQTNWDFVNQIQDEYAFSDSGIVEYFQPEYNSNFNYYQNSLTANLDLHPLQGAIGELSTNSDHQILFLKSSKGLITLEPLLFLLRAQRREAIIMGTDIWKWRLENYRTIGNFQSFDVFMTNIWNFLSNGGSTNRLTVNYQPIYESLYDARLQARFFDESLNFDTKAKLQLQLKDSTGNLLPIIQMSRRTEYFEANLNSLQPGTYTFQVNVSSTDYIKTGQFIISNADTESLNSGADWGRLNILAENTGGTLYFPETWQQLKDSLTLSNTYRPLQISRNIVVSLIDVKLILGLIFAAFAAEWVLRKFHGLI